MEKYNLGELGQFKNGVNFSSDKMGSGYPLVNVKDVTDNCLISDDLLSKVNLDIKPDSDYLAKEGDLFFVRSSVKYEGAGKVGLIKCLNEETTHCGFIIRYRLVNTNIHPLFLLYYLNAPMGRERLRNLASGATIFNISQTSLKSFEIEVPLLPTQQRIASILSSYDDLIENNLKRIKLLEEKAFSNYKSIVKSEKLEEFKIEEICDTMGGGTPATGNRQFWDEGEVLWFSPTDLTKHNSIVLLDSDKKITELGLQRSSAKLVPPKTILMTSRASIGFFGLINKPASTNQGFINIIPFNKNHRAYMLFDLKNRKEEIIGNANGSTFLEISKGKFRQMKIKIPKDEMVLVDFERQFEIIFNFIENLLKQNTKLREARDILLPRLMNGEIEV